MPLAELMEPLCGEALLPRLAEAAKLRWVAKRDVLANRLKATGWESICHQALLEALGGRRNRAVFAKIALDHTIEQMREQTPSAEMLFNSRKGEWKLAGLRPANQPKARLGQYLDLLNEIPDWPGALRSLELPLPPESFDPIQTARFRKDFLRQVSGRLGQTILPGMSFGIANTLVADVFLPLLAADSDAELFPHWYHWQPGNFPEALVTFLRQQCAERGIRVPLGNGLQQGILQLLNEAKG